MMIIILCCSNFNFLHPFYQQRKTAGHMRTCDVVAKGLRATPVRYYAKLPAIHPGFRHTVSS